jgi:stage IV sporulation protein A
MADQSIYKDIATRTGGEIYVGVVGPVRTGKSTMIKKFMEHLVIPNIKGEYDRLRAKDELPQSAGGKTVMTTEPKFIPDEAVEITVDDATGIKVKLVDCVGYVVPEALGQMEEGKPRMVHTPWQKEAMPFEEAAEYGTRKVITDHATIGLLVTCDGSVCDLQRGQYLEAEERVARELTAMKKPFAIVLNSAHPNAEETVALALSLEEKYGAPWRWSTVLISTATIFVTFWG